MATSPTAQPAAAPTRAPIRRPSTGLLLSLVLLLSVGVFAPTLLNGYTFDDPHYARRTLASGEANPMVAELHPFWVYWTVPMNHGVNGRCRGFRPVTVYSYALANALAGDPQGKGEDNAWLQHAMNLLAHALATALVFLLLRPLTRAGPALIGALLFGVHALHSGAVAAIVGRGELLAFAFGAAATLCYTDGLARPGRAAWSRLGVAGLLLLLSLGSKESALAWAVFIPLYAHVRGQALARNLRAMLAILLPATLLFLLLRQLMLETYIHPRGTFWVAFDANPLHDLPGLKRILSATWIYLIGLAKVLWPFGLSSIYGAGVFPQIDSLLAPRFLLAAACLGGLLWLSLHLRRRQPLLALAVAAFIGFSLLTANLLFPIETIFGDRLYYSAVLGLCLAAAWLCPRLQARSPALRAAAWLVLAVWLLDNAQLSVRRSLVWRGNMSLTEADLRNHPGSVTLRVDMANLKAWNFDQPGAIAELRRALQDAPDSPLVLRSLAEYLPDQAEQLLRRALRSPQLVPGVEGRKVRWALGRLLEERGEVAAACELYEEAASASPALPNIRLHLLRLYALRAETEGIRRLLQGVAGLPEPSPFYRMYEGILAHLEGDHRQAVALLEELLPALPQQEQTMHGWLFLYASQLVLGETAAARRAEARVRPHKDLSRELAAHYRRRSAGAATPR